MPSNLTVLCRVDEDKNADQGQRKIFLARRSVNNWSMRQLTVPLSRLVIPPCFSLNLSNTIHGCRIRMLAVFKAPAVHLDWVETEMMQLACQILGTKQIFPKALTLPNRRLTLSKNLNSIPLQ